MNTRPALLVITLLFSGAMVLAQNVPTQPNSLPEKFALQSNPIALTRAARSNVYFDAIGRKAAIFAHESGVFESWVFPFKLFHDARISVSVAGQDNPVDFAARVERIIARPEATTLVASDQLFTIRAHFLSPIDEAGSLILLDVDAARPLTLTISFVPDLKPMWPAGMGGQSAGWREDLKAFVISESRRKYNAFFGCPAATKGIATPAHQPGAGALRFDIRVDPQQARKSFYPLIIAAGFNGRQPAIDLYNRLAASIPAQYQKTLAHYRRLREEMMSIESPDKQLDLAFEWAKVALDKGMIDNPDLGLGLVAGWGATGEGARPGFGWFFGGDAAINSYAMTGCGDFESVKAAFRFLAKYQRADGKIPHEISQSAALIKWFEEYPYAFIHADTTPFFIAAVCNLYLQSGDKKFIAELWPTLKKAYQFCVENDSDNDGILENSRAGLGASELGSLRQDVHQDIYLAAVNLEASMAMLKLAELMNDPALARLALERENKADESLNTRYWNPSEGRFAYALTRSGKQNMEITAWAAAPMIFRQFERNKVSATLAALASAQLSTDWGTRMLSDKSPAYDPLAYNNGGVWPFLTGFVAAGEYEYQRAHSAFAHLRQAAQMTFDFASGFHPEILSGDFYRPLDESVPHQLFSSSAVITPLLRGLLGLRADAAAGKMRFAPQLPATWDRLKVRNFAIGARRLAISAQRLSDSAVRYELTSSGEGELALECAPLLPALVRNTRVMVDGKPVSFDLNSDSAHPVISFAVRLQRRSLIEITWEGGVEIDVPTTLPHIGDRTTSLKVTGLSSPADKELSLQVEGLAGRSYLVRLRGGLALDGVSGAVLKGAENGWSVIEIAVPGETGAWQTRTIGFAFK
jgi:GH15 family glucan-1,4-alpha-glucosidase